MQDTLEDEVAEMPLLPQCPEVAETLSLLQVSVVKKRHGVDLAAKHCSGILQRAWGAVRSGAGAHAVAPIVLLWVMLICILAMVVYLGIRGALAHEESPKKPHPRSSPRASSSTASSPPRSSGARGVPPSPSGGGGAGGAAAIPELPVLCPELVDALWTTTLFVPYEPLTGDDFDVGVVDAGGEILRASLSSTPRGAPMMVTPSGTAAFARVSLAGEVHDANGSLAGEMSLREGDAALVLSDKKGCGLAKVEPVEGSPAVEIIAYSGGEKRVCATLLLRQAGVGRLPEDHYELEISPGVDPALVVAVLLVLARADAGGAEP